MGSTTSACHSQPGLPRQPVSDVGVGPTFVETVRLPWIPVDRLRSFVVFGTMAVSKRFTDAAARSQRKRRREHAKLWLRYRRWRAFLFRSLRDERLKRCADLTYSYRNESASAFAEYPESLFPSSRSQHLARTASPMLGVTPMAQSSVSRSPWIVGEDSFGGHGDTFVSPSSSTPLASSYHECEPLFRPNSNYAASTSSSSAYPSTNFPSYVSGLSDHYSPSSYGISNSGYGLSMPSYSNHAPDRASSLCLFSPLLMDARTQTMNIDIPFKIELAPNHFMLSCFPHHMQPVPKS